MNLSHQDKRNERDRSPYLENLHQVQEIGKKLYKLGGVSLMRSVAYSVPQRDQRELDYCFDGIGSWRA
ncbi:MAG: hypothetical protein AAF063_09265 [Cyanobacteria bacterium J06643_5]